TITTTSAIKEGKKTREERIQKGPINTTSTHHHTPDGGNVRPVVYTRAGQAATEIIPARGRSGSR
ncbi:MAG: hypothetical protein PVF33_09180, partial [Candidatus Latescibacterota bacterium]